DVCRLAWIGADWQRKRGDFAIAVAQALVERGRQVHLTMVGQAPPHGTPLPPFVEHVGFLPRRSPEGEATLRRLLERTHLLLLPSRAEAFDIVVAEAAAHAVPTVACDAGGLSSAVLDGRTGLLLPADASPEEHAAAVGALLDDQDRYRALATAARDDHLTRLNWRSSCELLLSRLARAC
ncbi:glycosyltransferase, partial [Paraconexibacter sp.]|uniref:glycosyltransferase n=1 Tax=Paraconexibacter sp. TaxID=2949640 RepID=UPI0035671346